jgi:hypothetical protein
MFIAPMTPRAADAWNSVKLCSRAWGTKWVRTTPPVVQPQTKKVAMSSQN